MITDSEISNGREKLRLLIVSQQFPSFATPTNAIYNKQSFQALAKRFDVKVLVPVDWVTWLRHGRKALSGDSPLDVRYVPYFFIPKTLRRLGPRLMSLSISRPFRRLMEWRPHAVLVSWAFPDAVAVHQLLGKSPPPLFCTVHGSDVHTHCLVQSRRQQVVSTFNTAAAIYTVSAEIRERLIEHGVDPHRLIVNYNGVDDEKFFPIEQSEARRSLGLSPRTEIFLFIGNIKEAKGSIDMLQAYATLAERGRLENCLLVYIGEGPDQARLAKLADTVAARHPEARVDIRGRVPHEQINLWVNASDLVCLPSHSEGVPNVILEAMRCGVPVVASNVGGIPEVLDPKCGVLVSARDIPAIADGLEKARAIEWDYDGIRAYSQKFQWGRHGNHIQCFIEDQFANLERTAK